MTYAMVDIYCASHKRPPEAVTLDIDDTVDVVHGHQQLALFNAHYDERCFQPIHVYDTATDRPVAVLLRPGKTPSGAEIRNHLRRLVRRYTETRYGAKSWRCQRRGAARIEATSQGFNIRYVVTNMPHGSADWLYDTLYYARGQAENLIKLHKTQLASDRTSCRSPLANQVRLVLHTGACWMMLAVRDAIPRPQALGAAEFTTLRMRLIKIAARITETATRVRIAFATCYPEAELFPGLAHSLQSAGP